MKFRNRKGVSVIIATLLLIAITVAAGIIVYVFVNGLAGNLTSGGGQQTTERLQMQGYTFAVSPHSCACAGQVLQIYLANSGSASTTISAIYYDGTLMTLTAPFTAQTAISSIVGVNTIAYTAPSTTVLDDWSAGTCSTTTSTLGDICFTAITTMLPYSVGNVGQIVIPFSPAPTAGTSHTVKVVSTTGATYVFSVTVGRSG